jgi:hypothetical protein
MHQTTKVSDYGKSLRVNARLRLVYVNGTETLLEASRTRLLFFLYLHVSLTRVLLLVYIPSVSFL